jgi:hypothetical protein
MIIWQKINRKSQQKFDKNWLKFIKNNANSQHNFNINTGGGGGKRVLFSQCITSFYYIIISIADMLYITLPIVC